MSESLQTQALALRAQVCLLNAQLAISALFNLPEQEDITVPKVIKIPNSKREKTIKTHVNHVPVRKQFRTMQPRK